MVNLNRQIRATQARQGGFSAHVLPGDVGYEPPPAGIVYTDGSSLLATGSLTVTAQAPVISENVGIGDSIVCGFSFPSLQHAASGGPFNEPYFPALGNDADCGATAATKLYHSALSGVSFDASSQWTWEIWYRFINTRAKITGRASLGSASAIRLSTEQPNADDLAFRPFASSSPTTVGTVTRNSWRHMAYVLNEGYLSIYDHGTRLLRQSTEGYPPSTLVWADGAEFMEPGSHCDIGQARLSPGRALYFGATITLPTAPFIAV